MKKSFKITALAAAFTAVAGIANAITVGVFAPDSTTAVISALNNSGQFTSVTELSSDAPDAAELGLYDVILTWSNNTYPDPVGTGDALKSYIDNGGSLVVSTYAASQTWALGGGITTDGYMPLEVTLEGYTPVFPLTAVSPADPVFAGVNVAAITGNPNLNHTNATLDVGASLLLQDANGAAIMARNAAGSIIGLNLWPNSMISNGEYQTLLVNALLNVNGSAPAVPLPASLPILLSGLGLIMLRRKRLN